MNTFIPLALPDFDETEAAALRGVLESQRWSVGEQILALEREASAHARCVGAVGVNSGTSALTIALQALGIGPGDEVIVPAFTFVGSVNAILAAGAAPVLVDVDPQTLQIDPNAVESMIGPRTRAVMAVHLYGRSADVFSLRSLTQVHELALIEDACEALGATCDGHPVGAIGDIGAYAFFPNKVVAAGEGGVILVRDTDVLTRCRQLRNQGFDPVSGTYHQDLPGVSARMSEWHAAIASVQFARLDAALARRQRLADYYAALLVGDARIEPSVASDLTDRVSWFTYPIRLSPELAMHRDAVISRLIAAGIGSNRYFSPVHQLPFHRGRHRCAPLPISDDIGRRCLALPLHASMQEGDVAHVCATLRNVLQHLLAGVKS